MALLNRSSSPVWREASRLPHGGQLGVATILVGYDWCRDSVRNEIVGKAIQLGRMGLLGESVENTLQAGISGEQIETMVDDALIGILTIAAPPSRDIGWRIPHLQPAQMRGMIGALAVSHAHHRNRRYAEKGLESAGFSPGLLSSQTEVIERWLGVLGIPPDSPLPNEILESMSDIPMEFNRLSYAAGTIMLPIWNQFSQSMLTGMLMGINRVDDKTIIDAGKIHAGKIDAKRVPFILSMIQSYARLFR